MAKRWFDLDDEIAEHDALLDHLAASSSPTLRDGYGIGVGTASEMLIVFGGNPERIKSEAAFARLCGARPVPAPSAMTNKHRLYRGGHRQANAASLDAPPGDCRRRTSSGAASVSSLATFISAR